MSSFVASLAVSALLAGTGVVLGLTMTRADAADTATSTCLAIPTSGPLKPGAWGTCTFSVNQSLKRAFTVTLDIDTVSTAGGGAPGSSRATEALLDGRTTGLQVKVRDIRGNVFALGTPRCTGVHPNASMCSSSKDGQVIAGGTNVRSFCDTFTVIWSLPSSAGNPYQGGTASIRETVHFSGSSGGH